MTSKSNSVSSLAKMAIIKTSTKSSTMRRPLTVALLVSLCCLVVLQLWTTPIYKLTDEYLSTSSNTTPGDAPSPSTIAETDTNVHVPAPSSPATPPAPSYYAVVIESQMTPNLIPLMLHFSSVLGPAWPILLFTLEATWDPPASPPLARALASNAIQVKFLPPDTDFRNSTSVSKFLTQEWFWEQLATADRVLLFQTDSVVCANAAQRIEDFVQYDYVGAPIAPRYGAGYNGGLSLRNPRLFLDIVREEAEFAGVPLGKETDQLFKDMKEAGVHKYEDQWFYEMVKQRNGTLPRTEVARTFAVETMWYDRPLGYHQPKRWWENMGRMDAITEYCPEVSMLIGRRAE